jgi:hypothetical protein
LRIDIGAKADHTAPLNPFSRSRISASRGRANFASSSAVKIRFGMARSLRAQSVNRQASAALCGKNEEAKREDAALKATALRPEKGVHAKGEEKSDHLEMRQPLQRRKRRCRAEGRGATFKPQTTADAKL